MFIADDAAYYAERERMERCLAANAACPEARTAHLKLACEYRSRARAVRAQRNGTFPPDGDHGIAA